MEFNNIELWMHAILIVDQHKKKILPSIREKLYAFIKESMKRQACEVEAIDGTENHVHVLFNLSPEISLDELLKKVKLSSQAEIQRISKSNFFWEDGFYVYSISTIDIESETLKIKAETKKHLNFTLEEELTQLREDLEMEEADDLTDVNECSFN